MAAQPQWLAEDVAGRARRLERPRLLQVLRDAEPQAIVLCAPAGYGKTVLAAQWLEHRRAAWYRATPADADPVAFAAELARAAGSLVPPASGGGDALAGSLADALADWPPDAWLAVDDYHLVAESEEVESLVDRLLTLAPVRLLVTTRRRPRWATARRLLYGDVVEVGRDELALTAEEAAAVAGRCTGDAAELLERARLAGDRRPRGARRRAHAPAGSARRDAAPLRARRSARP